MSRDPHDAVVIGGGHNGLVAAAYLARAGARTIVLEARRKTGGASATDAPWPAAPEFRVTTYSYVVSLMPSLVIRDLKLERFGYKVHPIGPYYLAFPDGGSLTLHSGDMAADLASIERFSPRDARAYPKYQEWIAAVASILAPLLLTVPPRLGSRRPKDLLDELRLVWKVRGLDVRGVADVTRLFTMSISDLLDDWFESPQVKGALGIDGIIGTWSGPFAPGTAYVAAHHEVGDAGAGLSTWGFPEGGMGAVAEAIQASAESAGATIRTNARVGRVLTSNGRAVGVALADGEEIRAPLVVTAVHPKIAFLQHLDRSELPDDFVRDIESYRTRSGVVKINLALAELPSFTADPGTGTGHHLAGGLELAHSIDYIERAFQDAREGRAAERPYSDGVIPTVLDPTLCPDGYHIMSLFTQWVPKEWSREPHRDELEAYADRVIDGYTELAPNLKGAILHRQVLGPYDMERELGLIRGNIFQGELTPNQLFHMRPAPGYADYRTPIAGLYQCGSGTHAGGGVSGIPAYNCVREILTDRKSRRRRPLV